MVRLDEVSSTHSQAAPRAGFCQINPVTKTGQRLYMIHMLLLPFLPISALIIQNAIALVDLLRYQTEIQTSGEKVDGATHLETFITNMQRERAEVGCDDATDAEAGDNAGEAITLNHVNISQDLVRKTIKYNL